MAQSWASVIQGLREDEITRLWLTDVETELLSGKRELLSDIHQDLPVGKEVLHYQGFDVKRFLRKMIENKNDYLANTEKAGVSTVIPLGSETRTFEYTNHESMFSDIMFLIFIFSERGSTI
jgi:hypothetical protein